MEKHIITNREDAARVFHDDFLMGKEPRVSFDVGNFSYIMERIPEKDGYESVYTELGSSQIFDGMWYREDGIFAMSYYGTMPDLGAPSWLVYLEDAAGDFYDAMQDEILADMRVECPTKEDLVIRYPEISGMRHTEAEIRYAALEEMIRGVLRKQIVKGDASISLDAARCTLTRNLDLVAKYKKIIFDRYANELASFLWSEYAKEDVKQKICESPTPDEAAALAIHKAVSDKKYEKANQFSVMVDDWLGGEMGPYKVSRFHLLDLVGELRDGNVVGYHGSVKPRRVSSILYRKKPVYSRG